MFSLPRMDRSVVKRTTLDHQGKDVGVPQATPADRILMVWPLTLMAWEFKEPNVVQPRLQRHVVRVAIANRKHATALSIVRLFRVAFRSAKAAYSQFSRSERRLLFSA